MATNTPKLFLSSTLADLQPQRNAVLEIARATGWEAILFETTPGLTDAEILTRIHHDIRSCDALAILLGACYGSQTVELEISYTHFEFALARKLGKPIVALVLAETEASARRVSVGSKHYLQDSSLVSLWGEVRDAVREGSCIRREYSNRPKARHSLLRTAKMAFTKAKRRHVAGRFRPGSVASESQINSIIEKQDSSSQGSLVHRLGMSRIPKAEFAQYFWDYNLPLISFRRTLNLCFGSGMTSSLLLVAFVDALRWTQRYGRAQVDLTTNNLIIPAMLADQMEQLRGSLRVLPGEVDPKYLATWTDETTDPLLRESWIIGDGQRGLFVSGVSTFSGGGQTRLDVTRVLRFFQALTSRNCCAGVLFIDDSNEREDHRAERIRSFLGEGQDTGHRSVPLAVCIGTGTRERRNYLLAGIPACGFDPIPPTYGDNEYATSFPVVAYNGKFRDVFGSLIG